MFEIFILSSILSEADHHGEEEGGSLTIKPPQAQMSRNKEKSHKHKKEKHSRRDHSLPKDRSRAESKNSYFKLVFYTFHITSLILTN